MKVFQHIVLVGITLGWVACTRESTDSKKVFRYNESSGISSLDPAYARNLENMWAVNQLFDGLVELDSNLHVVPLIAQNWDILDSGRTYVFHLRAGVRFHDHELFEQGEGRAVVASDFVYSFNRILDDQVASPGRWIFSPVNTHKNGGFEARDDSTLLIHLNKPYAPFLGMLSMQYCNVVPREIVDHYQADFRNHPIGTGPFKFAFWYENVSLVFHKWEGFWMQDKAGNSLPYLDAVKIEFVKDMNTEFQGLLKGKYDFMSGINAAYKDELLDPFGNLSEVYSSTIRFQRTSFLKTDYLGILVDDSLQLSTRHPLHDKRLRQALNWGLNRKEMARHLRNNSVYPANRGFIPRGLPSYSDQGDYGYSYHPDSALKLMEEAGYPRGKGLPNIAISTTSDYVDLCEFMQHEWGKLGFNISIDVLPSSSHREKVANSKLILFRKSWLADYVDGENFLGLFYSRNFCPNGPNYTHFKNEKFDLLFEKASVTTDNDLRMNLYRKMDSLVMNESPVIPLFYDQVSHFVSMDVDGLVTNSVNMLDLRSVRKH